MSEKKKAIRAAFRNGTLVRDGYKCVVCRVSGDDETLDPHHIHPREAMPAGGYVQENGATLCKARCHELAEAALRGEETATIYKPESLYTLIGSSYEKAVEASKRLGD